MARTRTLTQLIADVRWQSDTEGFTDRHTDPAITRALNQSIQEFRELISESGHGHYLAPAIGGTLTTGPAAGYAFASLTLPAAIGRIYGVDITVNGRVYSLEAVDFSARNDWQNDTGAQPNGVPAVFFQFNLLSIAYAPPADAAYPYTVWYLPWLTDLSAGADTFDGIYGWEDFVVFSACAKIHTRDDNPERYQLVVAERDKHAAAIRLHAGKRNRANAIKRRDVRGQRVRWI